MLPSSQDTPQESLEALERTVHEIQALSIIYNDIDDAHHDDEINGDNISSPSTNFKILTTDEYQLAQNLIQQELCELRVGERNGMIPTLRVEINLNLTLDCTDVQYCTKIHFTLPKGYPDGVCAIVSIVSIDNLNSSRSQRDEFASSLNEKARELAESDSEALMELVQDAQESASQYLFPSTMSRSKVGLGLAENDQILVDGENDDEFEIMPILSRRWIWVHHITNNNRCKDILQEARDLNLSGYLKRGYPGIIVIEGESHSCDEYVQWIKGNKSRPGGFGRNWGHHVRGEVMLQSGSEGEETQSPTRAFVSEFEDIGEDLADLAFVCRQVGMEDEFKKYVMQH